MLDGMPPDREEIEFQEWLKKSPLGLLKRIKNDPQCESFTFVRVMLEGVTKRIDALRLYQLVEGLNYRDAKERLEMAINELETFPKGATAAAEIKELRFRAREIDMAVQVMQDSLKAPVCDLSRRPPPMACPPFERTLKQRLYRFRVWWMKNIYHKFEYHEAMPWRVCRFCNKPHRGFGYASHA